MGRRAYMIIAVITALLAVTGLELYEDHKNASEVLIIDLAKIISGTLTGIGFLGAGSILHEGKHERVVGASTGASIWASGGLGLMIGFGHLLPALLGFLVIFGALSLMKNKSGTASPD